MKQIIIALLLCCFSVSFASAQMQVEPDLQRRIEKLTGKKFVDVKGEDAKMAIDRLRKIVADLEKELENLTTEEKEKRAELKKLVQSLKDCEEELYALLGASSADIDAFRQKLGVLAGKVREMQQLSDDQLADRQDQVKALEAELNEMRGNKIALLPEFFDRIIQLGKDIKGLYREKRISTYTVQSWYTSQDCLWNIAGREMIYGDPNQWPKIWQANLNQISNPDLIYAGQVLIIPVASPKTSEEMKAERQYYRNKRAMMDEAGESASE